jgi:hypothetical protein
MKKLSVIIVLISIVFGSCKKETGDENYHVSFTVDGINKTYTAHVLGHLDTTGAYISLTILGADSPTSFDNYMGIYLDNSPGNGSVTATTYTDNSANFSLVTTYARNGIDYESGQSVALDAVSSGVTITNHFKMIITSMTSTTIKGTFSGDYYTNGNTQTGTKLKITNGDFYVKFQ